MTASEREDEDPQRRSYRDPIKARLAMVDELKPTQWAATIASVARAAERGNWPVERAVETLEMLGLTAKLAKEAREVLHRTRRLKQIQAANPTPRLTTPKPITPVRVLRPDKTGMVTLKLEPGKDFDGIIEKDPNGHAPNGRFTGWRSEFCKSGLHRMTPENRITRKDRKTGQCRACTVARKKPKDGS